MLDIVRIVSKLQLNLYNRSSNKTTLRLFEIRKPTSTPSPKQFAERLNFTRNTNNKKQSVQNESSREARAGNRGHPWRQEKRGAIFGRAPRYGEPLQRTL